MSTARLQRLGEALEAAAVAAAVGDLVEPLLRLLDLLARAGVDRQIIGDVDDVLADADQLAPGRQIVDRAAVVVGVDDRRRLEREPRQILLHGEAAAEVVLAEERLQRDRRGDLAGADQRAGDLVDAAMDFLDEMLGAQEIRDAVVGVVVDQDRADQRLLGLVVGGRDARLRLDAGGQAIGKRFDTGHRSGFRIR